MSAVCLRPGDMAAQHGLSVYDACYLELAVTLGLPLATLDRERRQVCGRVGVGCCLLEASRAIYAKARGAYVSAPTALGVFDNMRLTAAILLIPATLAPAAAAPLAPHLAIYKLSLKPSADPNVIAASGTMSYEVLDACTAWTTAQHLVIDLTNKDGQDVKMVSDYATLEAKDGRHLEFHTRQVTDSAVTQVLDGTATLEKSGRGTADFTSPEHRQVTLPAGTLLPMAHTSALIDAAAAGRKFIAIPLFDGTNATGAQDTFITVESWKAPSNQAWPALSGLPYGRIHIAFFDRTRSAETPNYEVGMQYFENGVANGLLMNFGEFSMEGTLSNLSPHPAPHC